MGYIMHRKRVAHLKHDACVTLLTAMYNTISDGKEKEKSALKQHFLRTAQRTQRYHALSVMAPSFICGSSHRR
jgi:hypothetical protein